MRLVQNVTRETRMRVKTGAMIACAGLVANVLILIANDVIIGMARGTSDRGAYETIFEITRWAAVVTLQGSLLVLAYSLWKNARL